MEEKAPAGVHDHEEEEEEEEEDTENDDALSLSDLPTTPMAMDQINSTPSTRKILPRRSSSEPADFFEFLHSDDSIMMSHAEDIFFCGKLVPFDPHPYQHQHQMKRQSFYRRRSESFPDPIIMNPRGGGGGGGSGTRTEEVLPLIRRKKLRRNFSTLSEKTLIRSNNPSTKSEISTKSSINFTPKHTASATATASRWLFLIFGFVKPLPEMDLIDIKNRQVRRTPTTMFPPHIVDAGVGKKPNPSPPVRRRPWGWEGKRRTSWGLLSVLSCRSNTSVDVTTPFRCMPKI